MIFFKRARRTTWPISARHVELDGGTLSTTGQAVSIALETPPRQATYTIGAVPVLERSDDPRTCVETVDLGHASPVTIPDNSGGMSPADYVARVNVSNGGCVNARATAAALVSLAH
jgi:hypothetical protein